MEESRVIKKLKKPKRFEIKNIDLIQQRKIIVKKKKNGQRIFSVLGINGNFLRIKQVRNGDEISVKMINEKNWQPEYKALFHKLRDPWNDIPEDLEGNLYGQCSHLQQRLCRALPPNKKFCRNGKCYKTQKKKKKSKKNITKKTITKAQPELDSSDDSSDDELVRPEDLLKPGYLLRPEDLVRPGDLLRPEESVRPEELARPEESVRPEESARPEELARPQDSTTVLSPEIQQQSLESLGISVDSSPLSQEKVNASPLIEDSIVEKSKSPSVRDVLSSSLENSDTLLEEEEEKKELQQLLSQSKESSLSQSLSRDASKQKLSETFSQQCKDLISSIKTNFKNLSLQSKEYQKLLRCAADKNKEQLKEYEKIDKLLYPHLDDPDIALKIANKKEFRDVEIPQKTRKQIDNIEKESDKICSPNMQFELEPHQKFIRNFLSFQSPYNSLLIFHGLGTGKTCSSISVCEEMRNYYQQIGSTKKIMIIASPVVQENYKLQLFDERKLKLINGLWNLKACTGNKFIKEVNPMNTKGLSKERVAKQIKKIIRQSYEFLGYTEFANKIDKVMKKVSSTNDKKLFAKQRRAIEREFSGRLLVIDEVHNIRANDVKRRTTKNLQDLVSYSKNMKLLLLTATPMFNEATEIVWLTNLMNLNDNRFPIKVQDIFTKDNTFVEKSGAGKELLIQKLNGYVSYVSGENPFSFPFRIFPSDFNSPHSLKILKTTEWRYPTQQINGLEITMDKQINYLDVYVNTLDDFQERAYDYLIKKMKKKYPKLNEKKHGIQYTMIDGPLQILNFAYPHLDLLEDDYLDKDIENKLYGKKGLRRLMNYTKSTKREFSYKSSTLKHFGRIFSSTGEDPPLRKFSVKIHEFIKTVKQSEGICLIYSNFIDGGCVPIALALEEMGIYRFNKDKSLFKDKTMTPYKINGHDAKYIMITGDKKLSPNNKLELKGATDSQNANGEKVKVIIISKAGSEGLDFQNIRQVHILEPWYNLNRADQIIGRGVRNKSHCLLPFNKRTVEIYLHASELKDNPLETIDMYMYRVAENKSIKIGQVTRLLKEHAVDCLLNKNQLGMNASNIQKNTTLILSNNQEINFEIGHKDNSLICDFMECQYSCKPNAEYGEEVNNETYNENYIIMNIEKILNKIKLLFKEHYIYEKQDLILRLTSMKHYSLEQINMALDILINDDNEFLIDMLGRTGRLINVEKYYMFQPIEIDESVALTAYQRRHPINFKHKSLVFDIKTTQEKQDDIDSQNSLDLLISKFRKGEITEEEKRDFTEKLEEELKKAKLYKDFIKPHYIPLVKSEEYPDKKNWTTYAKNAIENLVTYNDLSKEMLIELSLEHVFDSFNAKDKLKLLNDLENFKLFKGQTDFVNADDRFFTIMEKIINKNKFTIDDVSVIGIVDHNKKMFRHPLGIGFFKLDTSIFPNKWTTNTSGISKNFVSLLKSRFLIDKSDYNTINNSIGFLTNAKNKIVFKFKDIASSEHRRTRFGQKLPTSGENKRVTVHRMNKILRNLKPETKYGMSEDLQRISSIYGEEISRKINDAELASELELVLRYLDINSNNDKKWFFSTLEDRLNNVEKIKIENK